MFKFNFSNDSDVDKTLSNTDKQNFDQILACEQINPGEVDQSIQKQIFRDCKVKIYESKEHSIKYFSCSDILKVLRLNTKNLASIRADSDDSDLKSGIYEGGLKIWECTYDLINYIETNNTNLKDKKVLDLGCGAGLVGLLCLVRGAVCTFQDYNSEVLTNVTIPNILLNDALYLNKCTFFSGDWQSFTELNLENKFDYILTSETIYNIENYPKLHLLFEKLLKTDGEVYLAAKSHYFGVGGGLSLFQDHLKRTDVFNSTVSWKSLDGVNRAILKIAFK